MAMLFLFVFRFELFSPIFLFFKFTHPRTISILSEYSVDSRLFYDLSISLLKDFSIWIIFCYLSQLLSPVYLLRLFFLWLWTRRRWWWRRGSTFRLLLRNLLCYFLLHLCLLLNFSDYLLLLYLDFWRTLFLFYHLFNLFPGFLLYFGNFFSNYYFRLFLNLWLLCFFLITGLSERINDVWQINFLLPTRFDWMRLNFPLLKFCCNLFNFSSMCYLIRSHGSFLFPFFNSLFYFLISFLGKLNIIMNIIFLLFFLLRLTTHRQSHLHIENTIKIIIGFFLLLLWRC